MIEANNPNWPFVHLITLDAHELENMLSTDLLSAAFNGDATRTRKLEKLRVFEQLNCKDLRTFMDLKEGITYGEVLDIVRSSPEYIFQSPIRENQNLAALGVGTNCLRLAECQEPEACKCPLLEPLGENILRDVVKVASNTWPGSDLDAIAEGARSTWVVISTMLVSWGLGSAPLRV
ncbi:MAG: hypothetical protein NTW19_12760 [Planctomycetota bacterium]|nr:hypothetical protein [Planctomycetota bacterium]